MFILLMLLKIVQFEKTDTTPQTFEFANCRRIVRCPMPCIPVPVFVLSSLSTLNYKSYPMIKFLR